MITSMMLKQHWPNASNGTISAIVDHLDALDKRNINTPRRLIYFMGQISEEWGAGTEIVENLNYTHAQRIMAVWPTRFPRYAAALPYVNNPKALACKVYNGRMGNRPGTSDGFDYRGRGPLQLTGLDSYRAIGEIIGLDLVTFPDLAADPRYMLDVGAAEFEKLGCLPACDRDDVRLVTKLVNGGLTGLRERISWVRVWKHELL